MYAHVINLIGTVYNPEYYAKLSEIFRRYHSRIEQKVKVKSEHGPVGSSTYEDAPVASGTNNEEQLPAFTPRQLSLSQMLRDPLAPWRDYIPLRGSQSSRGVRHGHLAGIHLSHSMTFLLDAGAQLIDIRPEELYEHLLKVETSFVDTVTTRLKKIDALVSNT